MSPDRLLVHVEKAVAHAPVCQEAVQMPCWATSALFPCELHAQASTTNACLACGALGSSVMRKLPMDHPLACSGWTCPWWWHAG
eukprot:49836-Prorocentrum_lima.AAC.1